MSQNPSNTSSDLENQLRGMILSNVTIAGGQNHYDGQPGQHRGRGRGRGGFYRGSGPNPRGGYAHRNTRGNQSCGMNMASSSTRGGGTDTNNNETGPRSQQPHNHAYAQHRNDAPHPQILQRPRGGFNQTGQAPRGGGPHQYPRPQYAQSGYQNQPRIDSATQVQFMEEIVERELPKVEMTEFEISKHETFRKGLEAIMQQAFDENGGEDLDYIRNISLVAFGSLGSGFGLPGSDMDLAVVPQWSDPARADETDIGPRIPRLLEKAVLDAKMGGRLLTRTRVPILKVCENPTDALYTALMDERKKWDGLSEEEQYPRTPPPVDPTVPPPTFDEIETEKALKAAAGQRETAKPRRRSSVAAGDGVTATEATTEAATEAPTDAAAPVSTIPEGTLPAASKTDSTEPPTTVSTNKEHQNRPEKQWHREKVLGPLDFPKTGVGIQCDINFANPLGIHNTHMLRCYSLTDPRVRPMVLFVKSWAKRRKINSSYSGTLSSYGWVLMVLHYLVNVASPPVCPNLQHYLPQATDINSLVDRFKDARKISGYDVRFWRNEEEIIRAAQEGRLTQNRQPLASLLCGFFRYFASQGGHYGRQTNFYWTSEVLSLRTPGGILSKQDKGWVSATTIVTAEKKVTNRYLFAIEDPFEIDHNVARTVTHRGIVTIRDEFRRAGRILGAVGRGMEPEGGLFDELIEEAPAPTAKVEGPEAKMIDQTNIAQ
ncbi:PAP/OAS1 substrate-binding domain-containing protein [Macroventuria anomochaeta]|uniref:PAP/OAS1 substrate-binding domain-containing protein n=1 Tax=Macroventuria anomochaeta TaxID=301207 RepID=A0ACB6SI79_9PLEO|nr:PAP/OAS1 substrate-binding domain-containing protein [Macroventuria anomochaeta]KAF2633662.1 PAP/OAS1 substrate-binding domain-containing protein [Macroventuria anomochaeta]